MPKADSRRVREMASHAVLVAVIGWLAVVGFTLARLWIPDRLGIQPDFVHFYTIGDLVRTGDLSWLYDDNLRYTRQSILLGADTQHGYPNGYPPIVAYLFAPFSTLPLVAALAAWGLVTLALYLWMIRAVRGSLTGALVCVLAFPPLLFLVAGGQTGILPFLAWGLAFLALRRGALFMAGLALSLLAIKPQHAIALVPLLLIAREWRVIAGALVGGLAQLGVSLALVGPVILGQYLRALPAAAALAAEGEPRPFLQHSLRALVLGLPSMIEPFAYGLLSILAIGIASSVWSRTRDWRVRLSAALLASVLVNPHFYIYDAIVLVWPVLWLAEIQTDAEWLWVRAYWLSWAFLLPTAALVPVQASVLIIGEGLWQVWRRAPADEHVLTSGTAEGGEDTLTDRQVPSLVSGPA